MTNDLIAPQVPLAQFLRPDNLEGFIGQSHITGQKKILFNSIKSGNLQSFLFWGPPGSGKTTLANIIAKKTESIIVMLNSVNANTKILKEVFEEAEKNLNEKKLKTILFIDEIHRFNKSQQDLFLPYVEKGIVYLISATTENPSFEINSQLLSRLKVLRLYPLKENDIGQVIKNAFDKKHLWNSGLADVECSEEVIDILKKSTNGDARLTINILESMFIAALAQGVKILTRVELADAAGSIFLQYDKAGDEHYNLISALHKSLRGSDVNASIYWCCRILEGGEDPLYICRRIIRMAAEDIGAADPNALTIALNAYKTYDMLGSPEGELAIIEAIVYLSSAPKSNALYNAYNACREFVKTDGYRPVPLHLCNAPTKLMKEFGYAKNYKYPFNYKYNFVDEKYFPDSIEEQNFYKPSQFGFEKEITKRMEFWQNLRNNGSQIK